MENVNQNHETVKVADWVLSNIIAAIPILGVIMLFIWAFSRNTNPNKSNWAKAMLILMIMSMLLMLIMYQTMPGMMDSFMMIESSAPAQNI
jgi:integral membrane sensor domain MASE1